MDGIFLYFLIILQNYTAVSKFISFDNQPPWAVASPTAVGHNGCRRRLQEPHGGRQLPSTAVGYLR
jgi:hypothetical protein